MGGMRLVKKAFLIFGLATAALAAPPDFGRLIDGERAADADNARLVGFPRYRTLVETIERDLKELKSAYAAADAFPAKWLRAKDYRFRFIGQFNRLDRRAFTPDACGEWRLIYRLGNAVGALPMTIDMVYGQKRELGDPKCELAARRWTGETPPDFVPPQTPLRIEINLQSAHWRPKARPDFGGDADSLLRVFVFTGDALAVAPLENTPSVAKLRTDKKLRAKLLAFLQTAESTRRLDDGTLSLPREFLTDRVVAAHPLALRRPSNFPFSEIFKAVEFRAQAYPSRRLITTPERLLRRLDEMSCQGCHSTRAIAGFHFVGDLTSPHARDDEARRLAFTKTLAAGATPSEATPFVARAVPGRGHYGESCLFDDWTCGEGLACRAGECVRATSRVGEACEIGRVESDGNPHRDRLVDIKKPPCLGRASCRARSEGFPEGACVLRCENKAPTCFGEFEVGACGASAECRADYVCTTGACVPALLLPRLSVSDHDKE